MIVLICDSGAGARYDRKGGTRSFMMRLPASVYSSEVGVVRAGQRCGVVGACIGFGYELRCWKSHVALLRYAKSLVCAALQVAVA